MPYIDVEGNYRIWFRTYGKRSGLPVLLFHGFTGTHLTWTALCKTLRKEYFLIVPDLPGHGRSGVSSILEFMNLDATSDNFLKLLDLLRIRKCTLLGYSLGGRLALNFALKYQDRLACLILEGASPGLQNRKEREARSAEDDALAKDIEKYGRRWFVEYWENMTLFATQKNLSSQLIEMIKNERLLNTEIGLNMSLRASGVGRMRPIWDQLSQLKIPVMIVVGERDSKFLEIAEAMKKRIPHCTLEIVKEAGHCTHLEKPAIFGDLIKRFLNTCSSSGEGTIW